MLADLFCLPLNHHNLGKNVSGQNVINFNTQFQLLCKAIFCFVSNPSCLSIYYCQLSIVGHFYLGDFEISQEMSLERLNKIIALWLAHPLLAVSWLIFFFSLFKPSEGVCAEDLGVFLIWLKGVSSGGVWFSLYFLYNAIKLESRVAATKQTAQRLKEMYSGIWFVLEIHSCLLKISYTSIKLHLFPIPSSMKRVYKLVNFILLAIVYSLWQW